MHGSVELLSLNDICLCLCPLLSEFDISKLITFTNFKTLILLTFVVFVKLNSVQKHLFNEGELVMFCRNVNMA